MNNNAMTSVRQFILVVAAALAAAVSPPGNALTEVPADRAPDAARVIVKLKAQSNILSATGATATAAPTSARAVALGQRIGVALTAGAAISDRTQVVFANGISSQALADRLAQQPDVEYAVPDRRKFKRAAPNDPLYLNGGASGPASGQWYLRPNVGDVKSSIDVEPAWNVTIGSPAIVVADIDTGVRFDHPDNATIVAGGNLLPGYDMISDVATANDGDGRDADPSDPGDWVTQAEISNRGGPFFECTDAPEDSSWHGTQTSGLIAASTDNQIGMASVGRTVRLLPVRVLGKCGGFDSDIIAAMRWAAGMPVPGVPTNPNPARVLNLSLGGNNTCDSSYQDAINTITAAGVAIVVSAGNSSFAVESPANCAGVIAVGALRQIGTKVGFSDFGPEVTISAPGGNCVNTTGGPCLYPILTTTNAGTTVPTTNGYSDSFNPSIGTSFSAPLVSGTVALMLAARPTLMPAQLKQMLQATARAFPTSGSDPTIVACTAPATDAMGHPIEQSECYCTTSTCGAGMLDAGAAVRAAAAGLPSTDFNVQGLWWATPAGAESGWGINFAQQGDVVFATWFTYDLTGKAWWLSATLNRTGVNTYAGSLLQTHGPAFNSVPFSPSLVTSTAVGTATINFANNDNGTFSYTVNGVSQTKSITREVYGALPTCTFALHPPLATATNYQDLWWASPAGSESGWGINLTMQSNIIFATWFTYDQAGDPLWLSGTATNTGPSIYTGTLNRTSGPAFNAVPFNPAAVQVSPVGSFTLTFADGNAATFAYVVNGVAQSKTITRQVFRDPGTMCM